MTHRQGIGSLRTDRGFERRRAARRVPAPDEPLSQMRLRAGRELAAVNVSDVGVLAEGEMRLLPGTHVDVHLVTREGRLLMRSRVVRAYVYRVGPHQIRYRGALTFDRPVATAAVEYPIPEASGGEREGSGNPYPDAASLIVLAPSEPSFS